MMQQPTTQRAEQSLGLPPPGAGREQALAALVWPRKIVREAAPAPKRSRKRKPSFATIVKQAVKSGAVSRVEVDPESGKIVAVLGKPETEPTNSDTGNEWDTVQ
jgi:hypothetical protein